MDRKSKKIDESIDSELDNFFKRIDENKNLLISTGIKKVDEVLDGGLMSGLYILGSMPSFGKTTFINQIADNVSKQDHDVLFFSFEMSKYELIAKSLSRKMFLINPKESKTISTRKIMKKLYNKDIMNKALEEYKGNISKKMFIIEGNFEMGVKEIRMQIEKHIRSGKRRPIVFVDYIQIIKPINFNMTDKEKNDYNILELKRIARDFNITIVAISSIDRNCYLKEAAYENFKDTENVEYTADVILYLQFKNFLEEFNNHDEYEKMEKSNNLKSKYIRKLELVLLKDRNGPAFNVGEIYYYPVNNYFCDERIYEHNIKESV